ncbi:MAG: hypothetical protein SCJ94_04095 [Bacillota bacterium]|nr:hypothetical protein [Bacillota bacterium]
MESFIPLILIIIVFNVINAVMKAIRGGRNTVGKSQPVTEIRQAPPESKIKLWADDPFLDDGLTEIEPESVTDDNYTEYDLNSYEEEAVPEAVSVQSIKPDSVKKAFYRQQGSDVDFSAVFSEKNAFLSAFIFHEILEPPVTLRKKR